MSDTNKLEAARKYIHNLYETKQFKAWETLKSLMDIINEHGSKLEQQRNDDTKLLKLIHKDLLLRSECEDGVKVVDLSCGIWNKLKERIGTEMINE